MKKIFLFAMMIAGIAIISCSKPDDDPIIPPPPPPPVELDPTIELSISTASAPYGTDVVVNWTSTNAKTVSLNGEQVGTSGSKTINKMIVTTTFTALATNVVKTATVEKTVTVGEEPTPIVELNVSSAGTTLPYGNNVTVTWNITNFKTATFNGEAITTATGSKEFKKLLINTDFVIIATNFTKSVTIKKTVVVGDWKSSRFGIITHGYWRNTIYGWWRTDGVFLEEFTRSDKDKAEQWFFSNDFTYQVYNPDGSAVTYGYNPWSLDADPTHFIWGTFVYKIVELTETSFIVSRDVLWGSPAPGIHVDERYVFKR